MQVRGVSNVMLFAAGATFLFMFSGCQSLKSVAELHAERPEDFLTIADQRVHVQRWGESGAEVVLLHGFAASAYSFRELGPRLGERYQVRAVDLNGFGFTERPEDPNAYGLEAQVELVRAATGASPTRRVHLVGHSYGALVAAEFALRYSESSGRLVMISPPVAEMKLPWPLRHGVTRTAVYPFVRGFLSSPRQFRKAFAGAFHQSDVFSDEVAEAYRERLLVEGLWHAYHGFAKATEVGAPSVLLKPSDFTVPVLLLAGRHDEIVALEDIERFAAALPAATLMVLEKSGHSSLEEEPDRVAELISEFMLEGEVRPSARQPQTGK